MNLSYQQQIPTNFHDLSRVWIYQSNRSFSANEIAEIQLMLEDFTATWKSHGAAVKGFATVFFNQFIIVMADESATSVGGCSTDSSVRVIKGIEQQFDVQLFDRQTLAFLIDENVKLIPLSQLKYMLENALINEDTLYFNNSILTKEQLKNEWQVAVKNSWLAKKLGIKESVG